MISKWIAPLEDICLRLQNNRLRKFRTWIWWAYFTLQIYWLNGLVQIATGFERVAVHDFRTWIEFPTQPISSFQNECYLVQLTRLSWIEQQKYVEILHAMNNLCLDLSCCCWHDITRDIITLLSFCFSGVKTSWILWPFLWWTAGREWSCGSLR